MNRLLAGPQTPWTRVRRAMDWVVLTLAAGIIALAIINLNSVDGGTWTGQFVTDQAIKIGIGAVLMFVTASIDYRVYFRMAYPIYGVGLGLVVLATVIGVTTNQATRWLDLPFFPRFQPSELMKLALVVGMARYLHAIAGKPRNPVRNLLIPAALVLVPAALVVRQPDLSTGIILVLIAASLLAVTDLSLRSMVALAITGVVAFLVAWTFFLQDYQSRRIEVWLDPEAHPEDAYQILQARTAVGNGGFFGRGVGQGTQNELNFVPYSESDFSFAVFAEEWGFVGATMVLALYLSLVLWAINLASQARNRFGAVLCAGVAAMFFWHVVLNVGVVLEFFPNTGLPLPFFTHGGSNVVTMMMSLGILIAVSRSRKWR
jgi:rod shape determining protein RodA